MKHSLICIDWICLHERDIDQAVDLFYRILEDLCHRYIPHEMLKMKKQTHPWIDDECQDAIHEKILLENSPNYTDVCKKCSEILAQKY